MSESCKIAVCAGSGGVGKTTVSAALALSEARSGKRVLVMTIDPAKRLATLLGLTTDQVGEVCVADSQLYATLIQPKEIFDQFVLSCAPSPSDAKKMMDNPLYQQLSTKLAGSQEFTALNLLYEKSISGQYDLIVLDTPPTQHAIDFFSAPEKIHDVFQSSVVGIFTNRSSGFIQSLFQTGTSRVISLFEKLVGGEFMTHLYDFFAAVEPLRDEIQSRTVAVQRMLSSETTEFVLVTSFDEAKINEAKAFREYIINNGFNLSTVVINRAYPSWIDEEESGLKSASLQKFFAIYRDYYAEKMKMYDQFAQNLGAAKVIKIAENSTDLSDLDHLHALLGES